MDLISLKDILNKSMTVDGPEAVESYNMLSNVLEGNPSNEEYEEHEKIIIVKRMIMTVKD